MPKKFKIKISKIKFFYRLLFISRQKIFFWSEIKRFIIKVNLKFIQGLSQDVLSNSNQTELSLNQTNQVSRISKSEVQVSKEEESAEKEKDIPQLTFILVVTIGGGFLTAVVFALIILLVLENRKKGKYAERYFDELNRMQSVQNLAQANSTNENKAFSNEVPASNEEENFEMKMRI